MTRKDKRKELKKRFTDIFNELFPDPKTSPDVLLAILDDIDHEYDFHCNCCPRCMSEAINDSLDSNGIKHDSEEDLDSKVH